MGWGSALQAAVLRLLHQPDSQIPQGLPALPLKPAEEILAGGGGGGRCAQRFVEIEAQILQQVVPAYADREDICLGSRRSGRPALDALEQLAAGLPIHPEVFKRNGYPLAGVPFPQAVGQEAAVGLLRLAPVPPGDRIAQGYHAQRLRLR